MKYVFRVLSTSVKESLFKASNGEFYYQLPLVIESENNQGIVEYALIPVSQTSKKGDKLYFYFDSKKENYDIILNDYPISDNKVLNAINKDYIRYIINSRTYNPKLSHAINNLIPVGIHDYDAMTDQYILDKWSNIANRIASIYGKDLVAISPITSDKIYPFHYKNFPSGKFVREYLGNIIMFSIQYDKNYVLFDKTSNNGKNYIYYCYNNTVVKPIYQMINEEEFYLHCEQKDIRNKATTPFLKQFNDRGLDKDSVAFMLEDPIYNDLIRATYKDLRDELKKEKEASRKYLIPAFYSHDIIKLAQKYKKDRTSLSAKQLKDYTKAIEDRIAKFAQHYNENRIFYFSIDDLNIEGDNITLNSALKNYINTSTGYIYYDAEKHIVYGISSEFNNETEYPLLEIITKKELDELKDKVYKKWLEMKTKKFGR